MTAIDRNYLIPSHNSSIAPEKASAILSQFTRKKRAAAIAVPTDDARVRARLRELSEPITLFGEGPGDRRDRLRYLLYELQEKSAGDGSDADTPGGGDGDIDMADGPDADHDKDDEDEEFYTPGGDVLLAARKEFARFSLPRAQRRIVYQKLESTIPLQRHVRHRRAIKDRLSGYSLFGTQIAGDRPISIARFSPDSKLIAAGNLGGGIKLFSIPDLEEKGLLRGHTDRVGGIDWHPQSTLGLSNEAANLASGAGDGNIHLWSLTRDTPIVTLSGHSARVCRIAHHPAGQHLASASFDTTWRLWDLPTQQEILLQEGHSREVYAIAFQTDGALVASGGLDAIGRVWDLRTGRTIMVLDGHIREITGLSWLNDGYRVLSSSGDAAVKVWDVRAVRCSATVGAHKGLVSDVRAFNGSLAGGGDTGSKRTARGWGGGGRAEDAGRGEIFCDGRVRRQC